jgi:hypothetical protein
VKTPPFRTGLIAVLVAIFVLGVTNPICTDRGFIDTNTGSREGYREWFFGLRTGQWAQPTALETFMRAKYPNQFQQHWVSYNGTGRNIFGSDVLFGHGRPGPITTLPNKFLDDYCALVSEAEKKRLYDVFASGDREKISGEISRIYETALRKL